MELSAAIRYSLDDLGLEVSTGPVVDFRSEGSLARHTWTGTVPAALSGHFKGQAIEWPKAGLKKANAIHRNTETEKWLYPTGFYCIVRRFSSKEEKRRIVASVVHPAPLPMPKCWASRIT